MCCASALSNGRISRWRADLMREASAATVRTGTGVRVRLNTGRPIAVTPGTAYSPIKA